jgi:site-specific recombinase XerD
MTTSTIIDQQPAETAVPPFVEPAPSSLITNGRPLDRNPAAVYLASLSPSSRRVMGSALETIAHLVNPQQTAVSLPWHGLRFQHTSAIRAALADTYAHSTANRMLSALRGTLKAAWKLGLMTAEDFHAAASVANVKGETLPAGRHVPVGEVTALLESCDQTPTGVRDAAVIALLYGAGLRRAELVGLNLADYDQAAGTLTLRGKGNKERMVHVVNGAAAALADWLTVRGQKPGALFLGTGNRNKGGRLTSQAIYKMLQTRAAAAGVDGLTPHDFRRTFVGELLDRGADISTVQQLAGHANVTTTARYDRRAEATKRKAAELLHVPYVSRALRHGR